MNSFFDSKGYAVDDRLYWSLASPLSLWPLHNSLRVAHRPGRHHGHQTLAVAPTIKRYKGSFLVQK